MVNSTPATPPPASVTTFLNDLINDGQFELPVLPESMAKLINMCNDPNGSPVELANCIRQDQSIATHLLRHANSAMYSAGAPVVSLQQAVARLGLRKIREIVMVVACEARIFQVKGFEHLVRDSFRRSLATAAFSQEVARVLRHNVEEAFLCGLLHDIGRPVLLQAVVDYQQRAHLTFDRFELIQAIEGLRVDLGSNMIRQWELPPRIAEVVSNQMLDNADVDAELATAQCLRFSIDLADLLLDSDEEALKTSQEHPLIDELNIYPDQLETILSNQDRILQWVNASL